MEACTNLHFDAFSQQDSHRFTGAGVEQHKYNKKRKKSDRIMFRPIIWADILQDVDVVFHLYILFLEII